MFTAARGFLGRMVGAVGIEQVHLACGVRGAGETADQRVSRLKPCRCTLAPRRVLVVDKRSVRLLVQPPAHGRRTG
jgi:hypothetical protein